MCIKYQIFKVLFILLYTQCIEQSLAYVRSLNTCLLNENNMILVHQIQCKIIPNTWGKIFKISRILLGIPDCCHMSDKDFWITRKYVRTPIGCWHFSHVKICLLLWREKWKITSHMFPCTICINCSVNILLHIAFHYCLMYPRPQSKNRMIQYNKLINIKYNLYGYHT